MTTLALTPEHHAMLAHKSAITDEVIAERGYRSLVHPDDLRDLGFSKAQARTAPALAIPLWDVHGEQAGWQIRPDCPRVTKDGKVIKYENPKGCRVSLDVHPSMHALLGDPAVPLWITEGVKKGDALASRGACTIALMGGVWGFRGTNEHGGKVILPAWQHVALNGRLVYVIFDSDIYVKPGVEKALQALYGFLRERQALPSLVHWPKEFQETKWGVDDFFAHGHSLEDLIAMIPPMGPLPGTYEKHRNGDRPAQAPPHEGAQGKERRPVIQITTDMTEVVDQGQAALLGLPQAPVLYQRARRLCVIARGVRPPKWLHRPPDTPVILEASPAHIVELLTQTAQWEKWDARKDGWKPALPPSWFVETLQGRGVWPFPVLEGIITAPTLRPDGSLLMHSGYDPDTALYLDTNGIEFPSIGQRLTIDHARTAIGHLQEAIKDFPFAEPWHFSAALAAIISIVCRFALVGCVPLFAIRATTRGSGKSLLADVISIIGTGRPAPRWPQVADEDEERKRLLTVALAGYAAIHIDNVVQPLGSPALDLALTASSFTDRILGKNDSREAPLAMVWLASGNNMQFKGDTARRVVPIDLDPKMEHPEERDDFTHNPLPPWIHTNRPRLVTAAVTILKAFFEAGCPAQGIKPIGSFEQWSDLVRQALIWAGEADPAQGRSEIEATSDPQYEALATLLHAWHACYETREAVTLKKVLEDIQKKAQHVGPDVTRNIWNDLQDALGSCDPKYDGKNLRSDPISYKLRAWQGRVIDAKRLVKDGTGHAGGTKWCIEIV
jgi:Domain of unknown function (DUF3854)